MSICSIEGDGNIFIPRNNIELFLNRLEKYAADFSLTLEDMTEDIADELEDGPVDTFTAVLDYLADWNGWYFSIDVKDLEDSLVISISEDWDANYEESDFRDFLTLTKGLVSNGRFDFSDHDGNEYSFEYDPSSEKWEMVNYSEQFVSRSSVITFLNDLKECMPDMIGEKIDKKVAELMETRTILC